MIALIVAVPLAWGIALVVSHYAPKSIATPIAYVIDLLAAVPSVVFGLWGISVLARHLQPGYVWLDENLGWLPFFAGPASGTGRTILTAGLVLAIMILPIITAISREVFSQTPRLHEEAALALGATRWEMIRMAVFPYARSGMVSAVMLGLGRALGETMAVAMVLSAGGGISLQPDLEQQPGLDRVQHRLQLQGGHPGQDPGADRDRPGALPRDVPGQLRRPVDRRPQREEAGPMSTHHSLPPGPRSEPVAFTQAKLPRVGARSSSLSWRSPRRPCRCSCSAGAWSRGRSSPVSSTSSRCPPGRGSWRDRRGATDRMVTGLVWAAFVVAIVPLVSLLYTVVDRGLPAISSTFLTYSMYRTELDQEVGIYHALIGTLLITLGAAAHLGADRHHGRDLPHRVRQGQPPRPLDHLPGGRDDRHPVDRGRPVRVLAVHPHLRSVHPASASAARSRCRC